MANVITAEGTGHVVGPYGDLALDKHHRSNLMSLWMNFEVKTAFKKTLLRILLSSKLTRTSGLTFVSALPVR